MPKARTSVGFSVAARRLAPSRVRSIRIPGPEADDQGEDHHPASIDRQEHEAEIHAALQFIGDRIGQTGRTEIVLEHALNDQRQSECQQQPIEVIEAGQPLQHGPLQDHSENADRDRREDQRRPVSDARHIQQEIGTERAHHVERAVGEIDDVEHAEDHGKPKAEQRVERAVDQSHQKLCVESLHRSIFRTQSRCNAWPYPPVQGRRVAILTSLPADRHFPKAA